MRIDIRKFVLAAAVLMAGTGAAQALTLPACPAGSTCTTFSEPLSLVLSAQTVPFSLPSLSDVSIIGFTTGFSATFDALFKGPSQIGSPAVFDSASLTTQTFDDLSAGSYRYVIGGFTLSPGATIQLEEVVTAVPEPATVALLFAGLALVGFAVSRGRSSAIGVVAA